MGRAKIKIEVHNEAVNALRTSPDVMRDLRRRGQAVADKAGEGFELQDSKSSKTRGRVRIATVTPKARAQVAKDPTRLTSALGAARG